MNNNILITGGRGLVGSNIPGGYKPTKMDMLLTSNGSINAQLLINPNVNAIIHCAAKVGGVKANTDQVADFYTRNVEINTKLLETVSNFNQFYDRRNPVKIVSLLSTCVFPEKAEHPLTSDQIHKGEPHPSNYGYAYSKRMLEVQSRAYRDQYGDNFVTVVPCNVYGMNDNFSIENGHVIPALIHKAYLAAEKGETLKVWGNGFSLREFIYAKDLGNILIWVANNYNDPEPLIISPDEENSISQVAHLIAKEFGIEVEFEPTKPSGQFSKPSDNSKLKELMPDFKFTPIQVGLRETINWFKDTYPDIRK